MQVIGRLRKKDQVYENWVSLLSGAKKVLTNISSIGSLRKTTIQKGLIRPSGKTIDNKRFAKICVISKKISNSIVLLPRKNNTIVCYIIVVHMSEHGVKFRGGSFYIK